MSEQIKIDNTLVGKKEKQVDPYEYFEKKYGMIVDVDKLKESEGRFKNKASLFYASSAQSLMEAAACVGASVLEAAENIANGNNVNEEYFIDKFSGETNKTVKINEQAEKLNKSLVTSFSVQVFKPLIDEFRSRIKKSGSNDELRKEADYWYEEAAAQAKKLLKEYSNNIIKGGFDYFIKILDREMDGIAEKK